MPLSFINALGMWIVPFALFPHFRYVCSLYYNYMKRDLIGTDSRPEYLNSEIGLMYIFVQRRDSLFSFPCKRKKAGGEANGNVGNA